LKTACKPLEEDGATTYRYLGGFEKRASARFLFAANPPP